MTLIACVGAVLTAGPLAASASANRTPSAAASSARTDAQTGWRPYRAGRNLLRPDRAKPGFVRAALRGKGGSYSLFRQPAAATRKGDQSIISLALRGKTRGKPVCVLVRELKGRSRVGFVRQCVATRPSWKSLRVTYRQKGNGNRLRLTIYQHQAVPGVYFDLTRLKIGRRKQQAPPPPPPPATAAPTATTPAPGTTAPPATPAPTTTTTPQPPPPPPVPASTSGGAATKLPWAPPALSNPTMVSASNANARLFLDSSRDYVVHMPPTPITAEGGVWIVGGRNVVLIGGEIFNDSPIGSAESVDSAYGLYLKNQTGTVHVEGLWIHGRGIGQALVLDQGAGATIQAQRSRFETLHPVGHVHTDGIQTWRGPKRLRLNQVTIRTAGVGLQTMPHQFGPVQIDAWEYRHVNVEQTTSDAYALWKGAHAGGWWREIHEDLWVKNLGNLAWPNLNDWTPSGSAKVEGQRFTEGAPPSGDFVPGGSVGAGYQSPGYS